jgi:hypothetical protein
VAPRNPKLQKMKSKFTAHVKLLKKQNKYYTRKTNFKSDQTNFKIIKRVVLDFSGCATDSYVSKKKVEGTA